MEGFNPILPNNQRSKTVILLFRFYMLILAISAMSEITTAINFHQQSYGFFMSGRFMAIIVALIAIVRGIFYIILGVFFIMWMRRAYHNLHKAGIRTLRHSEGWAAGAWFVPFLNLAWPLQIIRDTWIETQNAFRRKDEISQSEEDNLTGWWWAMFLISGFVSYIGSFALNQKNFEMGYTFAGLGSLGYLLGAFLAVSMIKRISKMETEMMERAQLYYAWQSQNYAQQYQNQQNPQGQNDFYKPSDPNPPGNGQ